MNIDLLIDSLSKELDIQNLTFSKEGVISFDYNDKYTVNIEKSEDNQLLTIYGIVGELPMDERERVLLSLLEGNLFGYQTKGAVFSVDVDSEEIILFKLLKVENLRFEEFFEDFQMFLCVLQEWAENLENHAFKTFGERLMHY